MPEFNLRVEEWFGKIIVYAGSMNSGKTENLVSRLHKIFHSGYPTIAFSNDINNRDPADELVSAGRFVFPAVQIRHNHARQDSLEAIAREEDRLGRPVRVVAFGETQFLPKEEIIPLLYELTDVSKEDHKLVIVEGIDLDFRGKDFGSMKDIIFMADFVKKNPTYCKMLTNGKRCKSHDARYNARILRTDVFGFEDGYDVEANFFKDSKDGPTEVRGEYKFAPFYDPTIKTEPTQDEDKKRTESFGYINTCRYCFQIPGKEDVKKVLSLICSSSEQKTPLTQKELLTKCETIPHLSEIVEFLVNENHVIFDGKFRHVRQVIDPIYGFIRSEENQSFPLVSPLSVQKYDFEKNDLVWVPKNNY